MSADIKNLRPSDNVGRMADNSDYHKVDGMKEESVIHSLGSSPPLSPPNVTCQEVRSGSTEELVKYQVQDGEDVTTIYNCVKDGVTLDADQLSTGSRELRVLHEQISLLRINREGLLLIRVLIGRKSKWVVVCPPLIRDQAIVEAHKLSHQGIMRTYHRVKRHWYWPGMSNRVRKIVRKCETCQKGKKQGKMRAERGGFLFAGYPWRQVGIDLVGPFPETARGNKWILVLTDHFSRWQDALPLVDAKAETVANALDTRVFAYLGVPEILHSDRGRQFESDVLQELCDLWGVEKTRTTPSPPIEWCSRTW